MLVSRLIMHSESTARAVTSVAQRAMTSAGQYQAIRQLPVNLIRFAILVWLFASAFAFAQTPDWQLIAGDSGLYFKPEPGDHASCVVRFREDKRLRRTLAHLNVSYVFQQLKRSQAYSARFEARDTDTLYLSNCESVTSVVAIKVQRW
jgi:hypothetical protein